MQTNDEFPVPEPAAQAHSEALIRHIREQLDAAGGRISFERYMDLALYAPGLGYYAAGAHKLGEAGDFITAPEVSPLFARCLARQFADVLRELAGGDILELGAGSGVLAVDMLCELESLGQLPQRYFILEVSPDLRERQQQRLQQKVPQLAERVVWLDEPPAQLRGVIFGNEVLDALPVARFRMDASGIQEEYVTVNGERFETAFQPADETYAAALRTVLGEIDEPLPVPYRSEFSRHVPAFVATLADSLQAGLMLFIDYGYGRREYYLPERNEGTLMCHYRHRAHPDPFVYPGLQDITAYVDFTQVAETGVNAGMELMGFTSQAQFLLGSGLYDTLPDIEPSDTVRNLRISQEVQKLTMPGEMGDRFKVIGLSRGLDNLLGGFALKDLASSL